MTISNVSAIISPQSQIVITAVLYESGWSFENKRIEEFHKVGVTKYSKGEETPMMVKCYHLD